LRAHATISSVRSYYRLGPNYAIILRTPRDDAKGRRQQSLVMFVDSTFTKRDGPYGEPNP
jgi:hypothetical protein